MAGVARGDPEAVVSGKRADEREEVLREAHEAGPAMRDARAVADEVAHERLELPLDGAAYPLLPRRLRLDVRVPAPARDQASVGQLLKVVIAPAGVDRAGEQLRAERLGCDDLAAEGDDCLVELREDRKSVV